MRILHVISGFQQGGGEMMLAKLIERGERDAFQHHVLGLTGPGPLGDRLVALEVPHEALGFGAPARLPGDLRRLARRARALAPDLVVGWLYHGAVLGGLAAAWGAPGAPQLWSLHNANLDPRYYKRDTRLLARAGAGLSRVLPARIHYCAREARRLHEALGYAPAKGVVLENGIDVEAFAPSPEARERARAAWGVAPGTPVVGALGRLSPQKDYGAWLEAFARFKARFPEAVAVVAGDGLTEENPAWRALREGAGLAPEAVRALGIRADVNALLPGFDVLMLSSAAEAFPLALGEALAAGVPAVATDVGDVRALLPPEAGRVVPALGAAALAEALAGVWEAGPEGRRALGERGRAHIRDRFALHAMARRWEALLADTAGRKA